MKMNVQIIKDQMKKLKMSAAADELENIIVKKKKNIEINWLSEVLEVELDTRNDQAIERRIKKASFPERTSFEQFDWGFNKKIPRNEIESFRNLKFIDNNEIILFLGNSGTGKTHLAIALGIEAAKAGHSVFCSSVKRLGAKIRMAQEANKLDQLFKQILLSKLWIMDDWGVVGMTKEISEEIFDLFDRRKNNSAMILTSNRDVDEWPSVFNEPVLASAAIDRIFDRANICKFEGPSYRLNGKIKMKEIDKK